MSPSTSGPVVVIGSINMDLVCQTPRMPRPGETILGTDFTTIPGGKGANQAVAAAKLGGEVYMIGRVGADTFGPSLIESLQAAGVQTDYVLQTAGISSGCAFIIVDEQGENSIVVVPGANHHLSRADIDTAEAVLKEASVAVFQLEIPLDIVAYALERCREFGVPTILDPAPVPPQGLPPSLFQVHILTPNQHEAEMLLAETDARSEESPAIIGRSLLQQGAEISVLKLGEKGAMLITETGEPQLIPGFPAQMVDTTAAGDAFTGALALAMAENRPLSEAVRFANAAGALCCETLGAQPAMPTRAQVEAKYGTAS